MAFSSNWKMDPVEPGNSIDVPIYISSRENSLIPDELSAVTYQTQPSSVENVNQEAVEAGVVNSYTILYQQFRPANMDYYGERDHINAIQVPFAVEPTRNDDNAQRASPQRSTNGNGNPQRGSPQPSANSHGHTNNVPNEVLGVQAQGDDVSVPTPVTGLRRSTRKRNEAIYNEDLLANRLPRLSRRKGESSKEKPTRCLRMRASNHYPMDSNMDNDAE